MTLLPRTEQALIAAVRRKTVEPAAPRRRMPGGFMAIVVTALVASTAVAAAAGLISDPLAAPEAHRRLPVLGTDRTTALADYRGKTVIVTFYASWCAPCRAQAELTDRLGRELSSQEAGTAVLIAYYDRPTSAREFVAQHHLTLPVLGDPAQNVARAYGTRGIPETFVIDPNGRVASLSRGLATEATLRAGIARAERAPTQSTPSP